jgi:simple sugar transport system substrate-binding protein
VTFIGGGDWLQAFESGAKRRADALGVDSIGEATPPPFNNAIRERVIPTA